jgi:hypothetical protein
MAVERRSITRAAEPAHDGDDQMGEHGMPHESLAPITMAAGIGLLGFGLLTSPVYSIVGIGTIAWALVGWIREMLHE